jgi:hypothetical protein
MALCWTAQLVALLLISCGDFSSERSGQPSASNAPSLRWPHLILAAGFGFVAAELMETKPIGKGGSVV